MKTENVVLMKMAQDSLKGKWGLAIATFLVYFFFVGALQSTIRVFPTSGLLSLVVGGPFTLGIATFSLSLARNQDARFEQLFDGFKKFLIASGAYLLMLVYIILWMILLIIPGIIAALSYSMTFYIIAEDDAIRAEEAINKSKAMMDGYKLKYFYLHLRYLGLALLCILTLGIGFLWLIPFVSVCNAKFYDDIKGDNITPDAI